MRPHPAHLSLAVLILVGCDAPPTTPSPNGPEASDAPDATEATEATDSAEPVSELTQGTEPLVPGRYTRSAFEPPIALTLNAGWRAVQLFDGFFDVQQQVGSPDVIAVQFANVRGIYGADGASVTTDPDEAVEHLGANAGLTVLETSESRIGGLTGAQVTVENAGNAHAEVIDVPPGPLGIDPARRLWIAFFDTEDGLLAIMVGGSVERWDEALLAAEPVLESVQIGAP